MEPTYIHVQTDHSEDSLFDSAEPPADYNADELLDSLTREIRRLYPSVTLSVMATHGQTAVDTDGRDVEVEVYELINRTWTDWLDQFDS